MRPLHNGGTLGGQVSVAYHLTSRWGGSQPDATIEQMRNALKELDADDDEHPDASLTHESEWCLGVFASGLLVWENLEEGGPRHMKAVPRDRVLQLWAALSLGDLETIEREAWQPGYS